MLPAVFQHVGDCKRADTVRTCQGSERRGRGVGGASRFIGCANLKNLGSGKFVIPVLLPVRLDTDVHKVPEPALSYCIVDIVLVRAGEDVVDVDTARCVTTMAREYIDERLMDGFINPSVGTPRPTVEPKAGVPMLVVCT